jgi:hypothetical protein
MFPRAIVFIVAHVLLVGGARMIAVADGWRSFTRSDSEAIKNCSLCAEPTFSSPAGSSDTPLHETAVAKIQPTLGRLTAMPSRLRDADDHTGRPAEFARQS